MKLAFGFGLLAAMCMLTSTAQAQNATPQTQACGALERDINWNAKEEALADEYAARTADPTKRIRYEQYSTATYRHTQRDIQLMQIASCPVDQRLTWSFVNAAQKCAGDAFPNDPKGHDTCNFANWTPDSR